MTTLKDVEFGCEIICLNENGNPIRGHVVARDRYYTLLAWEKGVAQKCGATSWRIADKKRYESALKDVPEKFVDGWWLVHETPCEIVKVKESTKTWMFLAVCITAGAGLSRITSVTSPKENKQKIQVTT